MLRGPNPLTEDCAGDEQAGETRRRAAYDVLISAVKYGRKNERKSDV
jgi:hypothetical protein